MTAMGMRHGGAARLRSSLAGVKAKPFLVFYPTGGATHWHRQTELPPWTRGRFPMAEIGPFLFYSNVE
ncbi:hypothetical protein [Magnetospirillum moscoviense]|uniref:Uncharacterized protein n=1 Tax=Magnetospirillum moscoviense TaxID=1437059 RepID=A0A178MKL4_9PROT|nr:hypothetical protein [Magnetospirillum moscoviense]OAN48677.1 hypothetical protein A6A05_14800 [Magnetospirillum moscoviense]